jgi:restriction system protein
VLRPKHIKEDQQHREMTPESANHRKQLLSQVQRFENDESLRGFEAQRLIVSIFEGCDFPVKAEHNLPRSATPPIGVDFDFEATIGGRRETVAGEVKLTKGATSKREVNYAIERILQHNYNRFLFISRAGFSRAALKLAGDEHLGRVDLLNPQDLRRWIEKHALVDPPAAFNGELLIRKSMQEYAALLAEKPEQLNTVEWRDLERIMRETFEGLGFETFLTRSTKDGGFDLELRTVEDGTPAVYLVEIKHWTAPSRPGNSVLKSFLEVVVGRGARGGLILSTSGYTSTVFKGITEIERRTVRLGDQTKIVALIQTYYKLGTEIWIKEENLSKVLFEKTLK